MATRIKELYDKMELIANDGSVCFDDDIAEFLFGVGQIVRFLFSKTKNKPKNSSIHIGLEPFLKKSTVNQLQMAIAKMLAEQKYDIGNTEMYFERLAAQIFAFSYDDKIKKHQHYLLSGYFANSIFTEKKEEDLSVEVVNN